MSTPDVGKLVKQGFIATGLAERMQRTVPGRLASIIDQMIYDMMESGPHLNDKLMIDKKIFVNLGKDIINGRPFPDIPGLDDKGLYCDVRRVMREIHHYLEACALREVTQ